jgi:hypothetical protein
LLRDAVLEKLCIGQPIPDGIADSVLHFMTHIEQGFFFFEVVVNGMVNFFIANGGEPMRLNRIRRQ